MKIIRKRVKRIIFVLSIPSLSGCVADSPSRLEEVERYLGDGWECFVTPDGFKKAGMVLEVTNDGIPYVDSDYTELATSEGSVIGTVDFSVDSNASALGKLLEDLGVIGSSSEISVTNEAEEAIAVTYGGNTKKHVMFGEDVRRVTTEYASEPTNPSSKYFLIRESQSAESASIQLEESQAIALNVSAKLAAAVEASGKVSRREEGGYALNSDFNGEMGVCTLTYELQIERSRSSAKKKVVRSRRPVQLPKDQIIRSRN